MPFDISPDPGSPEVGSPWRFLWWVMGAQRGTLVAGSAWGVAWMAFQAAVPVALGDAVGAVIDRHRGALVVWTLVLGGLGVAQAAAGVARHRAAVTNFIRATTLVSQVLARTAARLGHRLSRDVAAGEVASLGASDLERIGEFFDVWARFSGGVVAYVAVAAILLAGDAVLGLVIVVGAAVVVVAVGPFLSPIERRQTAERERRAATNSRAADTVMGLRVLRGLGGEAVFATRFRSESQAVRAAALRTAGIQSYLDAGQVFLPQALVVTVTWIAAGAALHRHLSPGHLVTVYAFAAFLVLPVQTIVEMSSKATAARVAAARLIAVLGLPSDLPAETDGQVAGGVAEPGRAAPPEGLWDPTTGLYAPGGSWTAVVTARPDDAAGLVERLGGWVRTEGDRAVTLDGIPVNRLDPAVLRRRIVALDREPVLLAGALAAALDPPNRSGVVTVDDALAAASALDIVASLPAGLATELAERARDLSGGQRQRVVLAQSLVADPEVLVLDEPTSAVDAHTEAAIGTGLARVRAGRTTVVLTTSPLLLDRADRVVLIDGTVVAEGTHRQLLAASARYRDLVVRGR